MRENRGESVKDLVEERAQVADALFNAAQAVNEAGAVEDGEDDDDVGARRPHREVRDPAAVEPVT